MKLIIRCIIPLQVLARVGVRVGVDLDAAYAQRMGFSISTTGSIHVFNRNKSPPEK